MVPSVPYRAALAQPARTTGQPPTAPLISVPQDPSTFETTPGLAREQRSEQRGIGNSTFAGFELRVRSPSAEDCVFRPQLSWSRVVGICARLHMQEPQEQSRLLRLARPALCEPKAVRRRCFRRRPRKDMARSQRHRSRLAGQAARWPLASLQMETRQRGVVLCPDSSLDAKTGFEEKTPGIS